MQSDVLASDLTLLLASLPHCNPSNHHTELKTWKGGALLWEKENVKSRLQIAETEGERQRGEIDDESWVEDGWRSWHMLITEQQLILIYPGQERGSSALHLSKRRRGSAPMKGETKRREEDRYVTRWEGGRGGAALLIFFSGLTRWHFEIQILHERQLQTPNVDRGQSASLWKGHNGAVKCIFKIWSGQSEVSHDRGTK